MTYKELLKITANEKKKLKEMEKKASKEEFARAICTKDIQKLPNILARFFLDRLSDNIDSIIESTNDECERAELIDLYMKYEDKMQGEDIEISFDELPKEAIYI